MSPTPIPTLSTRRQMLRAGLAAALGSWAALELLGTGSASAAKVPYALPKRISMVGDSLTVGTMPYQTDDLAAAGWTRATIDAYTSRGVRTKVKADRHTGLTAVDAIRDQDGDTDAWIVALGTNDAVIYNKDKQRAVIQEMMDHIGPDHRVLWVNVYLPEKRRPLQVAWNATLSEMADERDDIFVFDWASFAAQNERWLAHDGMHCSPTGYQHRSTAISLASHALLPAEPDTSWPARPRLNSPRSEAS